MEQNKNTILEIHDLSISFRMYDSRFEQTELKVISDLYLSVSPGEIVAVAGASGSGKSLLASAVLGLLPVNASLSGHIHYKGQELTPELQKNLRGGGIALVPQSVEFLDPLMKVRSQTGGRDKAKTAERTKVFKRLGLPNSTENLYPFELSGGMARRVLVSTAMLSSAELIIADEPTPGMSLEQSLQALTMFRELAREGRAIILITHDIDLAFEFADRVAVFYAGTTVETAPASDFKQGPRALRHPYSKALWEALPQNSFRPIPGSQPYPGDLPKGCLFAPRCPMRTAECMEHVPPVRQIRGGEVRCFYGS